MREDSEVAGWFPVFKRCNFAFLKRDTAKALAFLAQLATPFSVTAVLSDVDRKVMAMARQKLAEPPVIVQVKFGLHRDEEDKLLAWFEQIPDRLRVAAVKAAIRGGAAQRLFDDLMTPGKNERQA